ncbi:MAG: beta-Ala-His dipeptidase [Lachnospiraceae bacterium]|nr:beta-Ala-His dipeptidase [Lachnospiraceae bacterium]
MKNKIIAAVTIIAMSSLVLAGCAGINIRVNYVNNTDNEQPEREYDYDYEELADITVQNFLSIAKIPRPSHHEEKIGEFFMEWAESKGYEPVRDDVGNVIFDVPATAGFEDYPLTALQVHMDMVCTADEGVDFDPLNDPINVIVDKDAGIITAEGTSLGADDGIGDAIVMTLVSEDIAHGPLRVIITVNEEDGMDGTFGLDPKWLEAPKYLINLDNEASDEVLVSTAAGNLITAYGAVSSDTPAGDTAVSISIKGLLGGHSGTEIDKGRLNGTIALVKLLDDLRTEGIAYELASFSGGKANNAIPAIAQADIVINADDRETLESLCAAYEDDLKEQYKGIEEGISITVSETDTPKWVINGTDLDNMIKYVISVIDGVYTWSEDMEDLVESSANLGVMSVDPEEGFKAVSYVRSSDAAKLAEIIEYDTDLAEECGYEINNVKSADPWKYDPDSRLLDMTKRIYRDINGEDIKVVAVHAGLECGTYASMNPDLDMISIGPDISDAHTTRETLHISTLPNLLHLITELLRECR